MQPSRYVAGSAADSSDTSGTLLIGGIAAAVAIAVAVVAITGNSQTVAVSTPSALLPACGVTVAALLAPGGTEVCTSRPLRTQWRASCADARLDVRAADISYEDAGKYESLSTYASRLRAP